MDSIGSQTAIDCGNEGRNQIEQAKSMVIQLFSFILPIFFLLFHPLCLLLGIIQCGVSFNREKTSLQLYCLAMQNQHRFNTLYKKS